MKDYSKLLFGGNIPKPLKEDEFNEYFARFKNGEKEARDKLITHNLRLVINRASSFFGKVNVDNDELVSIGIFGLI